MPGQLVFPFGVRPALGRGDFIVAPCNANAVRFIESWPAWPVRTAALYGPQGSGKTHLASVWAAAANATRLSVFELAEGPDADATLQRLLALGADAAIAIDDVDAVSAAALEKRDRALFALFERPSGTLLFTGRSAPSEWPVAVGDLRSRFDALLAFPLWTPDDTLLQGLIRKHFSDRQIEVPEGVVKRILTHVERTPEAIAAFVARADAKALVEKRAVTERLVLALLEAEERGREGG
jgi:chromosomal replication initiation ATPase DnaA